MSSKVYFNAPINFSTVHFGRNQHMNKTFHDIVIHENFKSTNVYYLG